MGDRQRGRRWLAATAAFAIFVGACGGAAPAASGGSPSTSNATPIAAGGETPASASPVAAGGGTLSIAYASDVQYFDPALAYDTTSAMPVRLLFNQLVEYDELSAELIPGLAESLPEVSSDGLTYTFTLRDGVSFVQQDGSVLREVTADDVVFSLNRILNPNLKPNPSPVGPAFFSIIEGAQAVIDGESEAASGLVVVDDRTVEIRLAQPDARLLVILAMGFGSVVPAELAGEDATAFGDAPIGTGPFYLESYAPGDKAVFRRNPHFWGDAPTIDGVEMRLGLDETTQLQQVQSGDLDVMGDFIPPGAYAATASDPDLADNLRRCVDVATYYLAIDTSGPNKALADVRVRRAMNHAIDKENLVRLGNGRGSVAHCIFPPAMPGFDPTCQPYPYDPERARALMAEAGYEDGFSTQLFTDTIEVSKVSAEAIAADLAEIGIEVEVVLQEWDVLLGTITQPHQAPLVFIAWFQDFPDPSDFIDPILSCASAVEGGANSSWYCSEEIDAKAAAALGEPDADRRIAMYQEIQREIMADAPWVPTTFSETVILVSDRVVGNPLHPVYPYDLPRISLAGS